MEVILSKNYVISIDMGGTKILAGVINSQEGIIARIKKPTFPGGGETEYVNSLSEIAEVLVRKSKLKSKNIKAVCLGIPGSLNPYSGIVGLAPNLGLRNFNAKQRLKNRIPFPVIIENDVNLGALGVKNFGAAKKAKNILVVFIGTGIGGAIFIDGKLYRGSSYSAGEIGHIKIADDGPLCGCGKTGCFEAFASRASIVKAIEADIAAHKKSIIVKLAETGKPIKSRMLASAVKLNDKLTIEHISSACEKIGLTLANITDVMNFDMIVLGGGLVEALDYFMLPRIKASFDKVVLKDVSKAVKIVVNDLGDDAALYGGIALAEEFLGITV